MTDAGRRDEDLAAQRAAYADYTELKGWDRPFTFEPELAEYYGGEFAGLPLRGKRLLEIGFGSGSLLAWAIEQGAAVAGTEINEQSIAAASERQVELLPEPAAAAGSNRERFDYIVAFDVFEHLRVSEIRIYLAACADMLADGGRLMLRFPNAQSPFGLVHQYADVTHVTGLSGEIMRQIIVGSPLEIEQDRGAYQVLGSGFARRLVRRLRYLLQRLIGAVLRFAYATPASMAPVTVLVLRRSSRRP